jgi:hypothetical protein
MVLTKQEAIAALENEVRLVLHLASKIQPASLDYRPSAKQRSLGELMQYFAVVAPVQLRTIVAGDFQIDQWRRTWQREEAAAKAMNLEEIKAAIATQPALFAELIGGCSDAALRAEVEMFGRKASRGMWIVRLPLCHYTAYRMQLFLYLKACGRDELNTMNLWAGVDS